MNTPNPLLPQGTLPPPGRSSLYFKILMIFAVHIIVLGGVLMVGCKDTHQASSTPKDVIADSTPMTPPSTDPYTPPPTQVPLPPAGGSQAAPTPALQQPPPTIAGTPTQVQSPIVPTTTPAMASHEATDYVIAEHDTFGALAKKFNVSIKALEDANPGVDPKKLQLKQTVHIPAGTAVAATTGPARATGDSTTTSAASGDTITYTVKAGDVLTKIATANHTTVNAIKALNGMKTATIYAGHTLKIPVARVASVETAPPSSPSAPSTPSTPSAPAAPGTAPVRTF